MKSVRIALSTALLAGTALVGAAAPASAAPAITHHGDFTGVRWGAAAPLSNADGHWAVVARNGKVSANFTIFLNGVHHVSYAVPPKAMLPTSTATSLRFMTGASTQPLVVTISGSTMTYTITNYNLDGHQYGVVTYYGTVSR